ncbi:hypothetical protein Agub_g4305 [Astrephomene gubernaculifera]|uniref:ubiquitinyl hydrolase 1 n=1 Tax=Astrephomene gubernaculifera TaxID=47775 RepID=A0AAD3DJY9_9CHLO|nr:hypothetical protein Agub_g4305 [Astrephomene gubernaculifera]
MRSDRGPVSLQVPQRSVLEEYKAASPGSFSGGTRQPSAGRKLPGGKPLLPEFPRRDENGAYRQGLISAILGGAGYECEHPRSGGGSASYASSSTAAPGRSTSVPRPAPRTSSTQTSAGLIGAGGSSGPASAAAAAAALSSGPASPRNVVRCPVPPSSILDGLRAPSLVVALDSLKTPSVVAASRAQRVNGSSGLDYSSLQGGTSASSVRLKRQAGIGSEPPVGIPSMPCSPSCHVPQQHYMQPDPLRPVYLSGPAAGTAAGGGAVGTTSVSSAAAAAAAAAANAAAAAAAAAASASSRRVSLERSAAERVLSRPSSFSSTTAGMYGASTVGGGGGSSGSVSASGLPSPSAPPLPAGGAVYASQYAYQYGSSPSTVYIPAYSAAGHSSSGGTTATYVASAGSSSISSSGAASAAAAAGAAAYLAASAGLPPRPSSLNVAGASAATSYSSLLPTPTSSVLPSAPPLMSPLSPSTPSAPPLFSPSAATHAPPLPTDTVATRSVQRTLSSSLPRPPAGAASVGASVLTGAAAASIGSATTVATAAALAAASSGAAGGSRLRVVTVPGEEPSGGADAGSNSSLRRVQLADEQLRYTGSGAAPPPPATSVSAPVCSASSAAVTSAPAAAVPAATPVRPMPPYGSTTATAAATITTTTASVAAADSQYHSQHAQLPHSHPQQPQHQQSQQQHPSNPHPHYNPSLEAGGASYSNASTSSTVSSKSSVAVAGTGVSSASSSRTGSSTSQRSATQDVPSPSTAQQQHSHHQPHQTPHPQYHQHQQQHPSQLQHQTHAPPSAHAAGASSTTSSTTTARHAAAAATAPSAAAAAHAESVSRAAALSEGGASTGAAAAAAEGGPASGGGSAGSSAKAHEERGLAPVCGPLPDLPVVLPSRDTPAGRGCVGLQNLGNTCFMNSILQSLNAVPELVQQFYNPAERNWSSKAIVAPAYSSLVRDMMAGSLGGVVNPGAFLRKVSKHDGRWGDGRQQDSQEFLNSLLEVLQSECNRITSKPTYRELQSKGSEEAQAAEAYAYARSWNDSLVDDIFGGLTQSTIQCHACKRLSHTFEPFLGLALPIPGSSSSSSPGADRDRDRDGGGGSGGGSVSVADCLRAFVECEELEGDDSYKCEACKRRQPHSKRLQIFRPPRVLVLTLKRFAQRPAAPGFFSRFRSPAKNNTPVRLDPELLDLTPYCNPLGLRGLSIRGRGPVAPVYQLVAVSHHSGSLEGGHYTAQARSCLDGQWYNFNDSTVRREARPSGASSSAYVLFYRLANLPPSNL